jgi:hypothetical protein
MNPRINFKQVISVDFPTEIGFFGFARPAFGSIPPTAEMQARLWTMVVSGDIRYGYVYMYMFICLCLCLYVFMFKYYSVAKPFHLTPYPTHPHTHTHTHTHSLSLSLSLSPQPTREGAHAGAGPNRPAQLGEALRPRRTSRQGPGGLPAVLRQPG